ncbi:UbiA family prenyltransferase [Streptomyces sp. NPDC008150]|uniref:UbiA family prenyltransferase n=1 Tax=Streptomyces sp. NPDC008150 TaxID=3364816 RepID=UPI0036EB1F6A
MTGAVPYTDDPSGPGRLSGHLDTLRPYDLVALPQIGAAGAVLCAHTAAPVRVVLAVLVTLSACAAALYAADYLTRHDDFTTKPHRPIPSGRLPGTTARRCAALAGVAALGVTCAVNWHGLLFIALAAAGQAAYAWRLKGSGWWGDLAVGLSGWTCTLLTAATFTSAWPPLALWPAAAALGLQGVFSNTLLALSDVDTDRAAACRTLPVRVGSEGAVASMAACAVACYALSAATPTALHRSPTPVFFGLTACGALLALGCLVLARTRHRARLRVATELHLYERVALPGALLALAGHTLPALVLVATGACLLALTPRTMVGQ